MSKITIKGLSVPRVVVAVGTKWCFPPTQPHVPVKYGYRKTLPVAICNRADGVLAWIPTNQNPEPTGPRGSDHSRITYFVRLISTYSVVRTKQSSSPPSKAARPGEKTPISLEVRLYHRL
ncbi:hypothetical protein MCOR31_002352 [Pyricularia oryzae]|uniref:Uncharacterized protein n=1 Tax=Pyricularia grisea TaxID=148305 RepID=A0ABQ8NW58_PYRGI|nr:hypothetical protein MCOR19_003756 [Pyricularia oryzae]KAI6303001.1 hypothetical protein MCOR33_001777 [Pyricularia grisea]KAI6323168.1 hypothetical protein MCOR34_001916 [Pyricularia oryzae]KAI6344323.1 hypothetical protein MCOR30_001146 [Pyricularia oryzae]KAI6375181.1 hypothetical protein MCOR31_002352 [Pyricularia oryzae]